MKNRKIKFRAWTGERMLINVGVHPYENINLTVAIEGNESVYKNNENLICSPGLFEIMQYTGLKDKNGKEIYEGDVVKWDDGSDGEKWRVAVVEINPDIQFRIVRVKLDINQSAKDGYIFHFGRFIYTDTHNHLHIIGNIYENPELIN